MPFCAEIDAAVIAARRKVDIGNFTDYRPSSIALTTVAAPLIVVTVPEALLVE